MTNSFDYFTITKQEIKLVQEMYVSWDDCEFGAPSIDPKRPYGNSDVLLDMAEILGFLPGDKYKYKEQNQDAYEEMVVVEQEEVLLELHSNMQTVLQILIDNLSLKEGIYKKEKYNGRWEKVQT